MDDQEYRAAEREMDIYRDKITKLEQHNAEMLAALKVARQMLEGTCQHGYDTSRSARGCDECAEQIEYAIFEYKE